MFPSRRQPFPPEEDFGGPFGPRHISEDPYFYGDGGQGIKRPFSMMVSKCFNLLSNFLLKFSLNMSLHV